MKRALGLDERQMRLIMDAARSLPIAHRDQFLRSVADRLGDAPTVIAVEAAIGAFFERLPVKEITS
jgi:hypothetical protein